MLLSNLGFGMIMTSLIYFVILLSLKTTLLIIDMNIAYN